MSEANVTRHLVTESRRQALEPRQRWLYVLKLEDECWYVGTTWYPWRRYLQHRRGKGAGWTKAHRPVALYWTKKIAGSDDAWDAEKKATAVLIKRYGADKVRGGTTCRVECLCSDARMCKHEKGLTTVA